MPANRNLEPRDQGIPNVFFPEHLRLGAAGDPAKWHAYEHAVETMCRLKGVEDHLFDVGPGMPVDFEERKLWRGREELCKAIITLNIKDFPTYGVPAGEAIYASYVWTRLREIHRPKRTCSWLTESVRAPTWLEWVLLCLLWVAVLLLARTQALLRDEMRMRMPVLPPPIGYYRDLLREYRTNPF